MAWQLTVGAPGSGRTSLMVQAAREACTSGKRVWWVGLPAQRGYILRRVTQGGYTALGLEVMSGQQMYYRLLTRANRIQPMLVGNAALVRVGQALQQVVGGLPTPGEAHLFGRAISEAKLYGVDAAAYRALAADPEQRRLADVYDAYEELKGAWDYDDVRTAAVDLAARGLLEVEADLVIVDGLRELAPLELRLYQALAQQVEVLLNLDVAPPGLEATTTLPPPAPARAERYLAPNPVSEARWVMRSLKRDLLAHDFEPLDVAVIAPPGRARALVALAEEYGVPLMDESPLALIDQPLGQRLVDLLELVEHPTAARLLAVPELAPLAAAALEGGVAGLDAVALLADELQLGAVWRDWLRRLEVSCDLVAWAQSLLEDVLAQGQPLPREFAAGALEKAQEAARLGADGPGFRAWWAALLRDSRQPRRERAGVVLTSATQVAGRRFRKAYLVGAVEGAYSANENEDYFLPEEQRLSVPDAAARAGLPVRFRGNNRLLAQQLLTRADLMVITAPRAGQSGPLQPDEELLGPAPAELPRLPAGSRLELAPLTPYRAPLGSAPLGRPTVERLRRYRQCPMRVWGEAALKRGVEWQEDLPAWQRLLSGLLGQRNSRQSQAGLLQLALQFPEAAGWLAESQEQLLPLTYNVELFGGPGRAAAQLHAALREPLEGRPSGNQRYKTTLYRFVAPGVATTQREASDYLRDRWTEQYAAFLLLNQASQDIERVDMVVWPILGQPVSLYGRGVGKNFDLGRQRLNWVREELPRYLEGRVEPRPGFHCRDCPVFDLCREGTR